MFLSCNKWGLSIRLSFTWMDMSILVIIFTGAHRDPLRSWDRASSTKETLLCMPWVTKGIKLSLFKEVKERTVTVVSDLYLKNFKCIEDHLGSSVAGTKNPQWFQWGRAAPHMPSWIINQHHKFQQKVISRGGHHVWVSHSCDLNCLDSLKEWIVWPGIVQSSWA